MLPIQHSVQTQPSLQHSHLRYPDPSGYDQRNYRDSSSRSSPDPYEDESKIMMVNNTWMPHQMMSTYSTPSQDTSATSSHPLKPLLKRRRVTRACDECRRKKIKCDGKHPCTHCTVYSYDCTYDQPSNRRRNPGPQYIEALEKDKQQLATLIKLLRPDLDPHDSHFDAAKVIAELQENQDGSMADSISASSDPDSLLESMVEAAGRLEIDETGAMDYHGHSSGIAYLSHLRSNFQKVLGHDVASGLRSRPFPLNMRSPGSTVAELPIVNVLPHLEIAKRLTASCFDDGCALMKFIHRPTFDGMMHRLYEKPSTEWGDSEKAYLPLVYLALAVGCMFAGNTPEFGLPKATLEGTKYFLAGRRMMEITDCRDIVSIQALILMVIFLQSSSKMSTCYSYVGIALYASLRMGLHRSLELNLTPIERETRKRIFWTIRKMDTYVSALLGLPKGISDEDIDQELPLEIDDEYITHEEIKPQPEGTISKITAANAHSRLLGIMAKVVKAIYPIKHTSSPGSNGMYKVSFASIKEIEGDLRKWVESLPEELKPGRKTKGQYDKYRYLLEMAFCHVQMMMYRPFIHYICSNKTNESHGAHQAARNCIRVAIQIVELTKLMKEEQMLNGAYWFTMYTTFFATISLLFYVLERPTGNKVCWEAANTGRQALDCLKLRSLAADRCSMALKTIFDSIPAEILTLVNKVEDPPPVVEAVESKPPAPGLQSSKTFPDLANHFAPSTAEQRRRSYESYTPSDFPSSVVTPDVVPAPPPRSSADMGTMMYAAAPGFFNTGFNIDSQPLPKTELPTQMDLESPDSMNYDQQRQMLYDMEAQVRNPWADFSQGGGQQNINPTPQFNFAPMDLNSANSNLMLLQGQTYGAMPGGGSAMGLEDFFGDDWDPGMMQLRQ